MAATYQQELHTTGSPEWANEVQIAHACGMKNGGMSTLIAKLQWDQHTPQFMSAI